MIDSFADALFNLRYDYKVLEIIVSIFYTIRSSYSSISSMVNLIIIAQVRYNTFNFFQYISVTFIHLFTQKKINLCLSLVARNLVVVFFAFKPVTEVKRSDRT